MKSYTLNQLLVKDPSGRLFEPIKFDDGKIFLSIQASNTHYCKPRKNLHVSEYTHFEVHSNYRELEKVWEEYHDGMNFYDSVPREEIEKVINELALTKSLDNQVNIDEEIELGIRPQKLNTSNNGNAEPKLLISDDINIIDNNSYDNYESGISEVKVMKSNAGYYIGREIIELIDGVEFPQPYDRISEEYFRTFDEAEQALKNNNYTKRNRF